MSGFDRAPSAAGLDPTVDSAACQDALTHWRAAFDDRLDALERALREPAHSDLSALIVDFTRVAGEEAQAAARQTSLEAQVRAQQATAAAEADREALEEAQSALHEARRLHNDARHALDATRRAHEETRRAHESAVRSVDEAQDALRAGRRDAEEARQALTEAERRAHQADEERRELAGIRSQLQAQLDRARADAQEAQAQVASLQEELTASAGEVEARGRDLQAFRRRLEQAVHDAEQRSSLQDAERARFEQLAADASAHLATARHERDVARLDLARVTTESEALRPSLAAAMARIAALEQDLVDRDRTIEALTQVPTIPPAQPVAAARDTTEAPVRARPPAVVEHAPVAVQPAFEASPAETMEPVEALGVDAPATRDAPVTPAVDLVPTSDLADVSTDASQPFAEPEPAALEPGEDLPLSPESTGVFSTVADALRAWTTEAVASPEGAVSSPTATLTTAPDAAPAGSRDEPAYDVVRQTVRHGLVSRRIGVTIDDEPGQLVDLSTGGAQVVTSSMLKPGRQVRLAFPTAGPLATARAKIVWSRLEPPTSGGGELQYRAGLSFLKVDAKMIDRVLNTPPGAVAVPKRSGR